MSRRTLIGVIAGLGLLTGLGTAFAQDYQQNYAPEPPPMGWNRMRPPPQPQEMDPDLTGDVQIKRVRGDSYIVQASDPQGGRVLIVVDGRTTEITGLRQIGMDRPQRRWDDDGWLPPRPWGGPRW
jgi:hypothetical protein